MSDDVNSDDLVKIGDTKLELFPNKELDLEIEIRKLTRLNKELSDKLEFYQNRPFSSTTIYHGDNISVYAGSGRGPIEEFVNLALFEAYGIFFDKISITYQKTHSYWGGYGTDQFAIVAEREVHYARDSEDGDYELATYEILEFKADKTYDNWSLFKNAITTLKAQKLERTTQTRKQPYRYKV